eukprot:CAMPEP_0183718994 /NCGR_PEP_ID=MMETSP0737-20130205/12098_1 /TAXON_ID=385413 /ORGANISM="Thalassiosira miniscula, Strain CCMP1093" /LENGTH=87 /DNA_ID=CAMNT_0025948659 /DNA_START=37 /DNA_END=300 /DNA_ORIENTATION=+
MIIICSIEQGADEERKPFQIPSMSLLYAFPVESSRVTLRMPHGFSPPFLTTHQNHSHSCAAFSTCLWGYPCMVWCNDSGTIARADEV